MNDTEKNEYQEKHMLNPILEEVSAAALEYKPENPLQFIADCLISLQYKTENGILDLEAIKETIKEVAEELKDQAPEIKANPFLFQRTNNHNSSNPIQARKRLKQSISSNSDFLSNNKDKNQEDMSSSFDAMGIPSFQNIARMRRGSVSAESLKPSDYSFPTNIVPKSMECRMRIASATTNNLLFRNLEDEQKKEIVDAMVEKKVVAGEIIIKQGDEGDNFYVVDKGKFEIFVDNQKVLDVSEGGSFGELALMYNTPRAATVKAVTDGILWAVDRLTFRNIITSNTFRKRRLYESFLRTVPILSTLKINEIAKVSDALEPVSYSPGEVVIEQGSMGDYFYMIESGEVKVVKTEESGEKIDLPGLKTGDYFGELALLNDSPRAVTVIASSPLKLVALSKGSFVRLLGPVVDILKRNVANYAGISKSLLQENGEKK